MRAERVSRIAVAAWAVLAVLVESYYASPGWEPLRLIAPLALVVMAVACSVDRRAVALVSVAPFTFPLALYLSTGQYHVHYTTAWLAAMLGAVLPDALRRPWHAPGRWRVALACWAGTVAVTTPIIILRQIDLRWELLTRTRLPHEALGGLTFQSLGWTGHVALLIVVGILWFDWLCSLEQPFFERWVVTPMAASAGVLALTSAYQMAVDINAVNPTVYARLLRATGTLFDANSAGAAGAIWAGAGLVLAVQALRRRWWLALPVVALFLVAVWGSGSRTAFLAALLMSAGAAYSVARQLQLRTRTLLTVGGVSLVLVALAIGGLWVSASRASTDPRMRVSRRNPAGGPGAPEGLPRFVGPLARFQMMFRRSEAFSPGALVRTLWERDGYGIGANRMIATYPGFGIGIGAFHEMVPEFAGSLPADNAQNWFRHQLAENGIVGSLGWLVFVLSFGWWVLRPHAGEQPGAWGLRVLLVVFVGMSLVAVPAQDPAIAITFWTLAAWYLLLAGRPPASSVPGWMWGAAAAAVIASGVGTARLAAGPLRVPVRIQYTVGGDYTEYSYGFFSPERDDEGEFRWTGQRATMVVPVAGNRFTVSASVNFGDLEAHPSHAKVWVNGRLVIDGTLTADQRTITQTLPLTGSVPRVLVETWTDRTETAPPPDGRELGLMVRWSFQP